MANKNLTVLLLGPDAGTKRQIQQHKNTILVEELLKPIIEFDTANQVAQQSKYLGQVWKSRKWIIPTVYEL
jgi:hypothetical protein